MILVGHRKHVSLSMYNFVLWRMSYWFLWKQLLFKWPKNQIWPKLHVYCPQAATSLMNQSSQPSTSRSTEASAVSINQPEINHRATRAKDEFRRLFAPHTPANASISRSVSLNSNTPQRRAATSNHAKAPKRRKSVKEISVKFFCPSSTTQFDVPNNDEKQQLLVCGLGGKR